MKIVVATKFCSDSSELAELVNDEILDSYLKETGESDETFDYVFERDDPAFIRAVERYNSSHVGEEQFLYVTEFPYNLPWDISYGYGGSERVVPDWELLFRESRKGTLTEDEYKIIDSYIRYNSYTG